MHVCQFVLVHNEEEWQGECHGSKGGLGISLRFRV